MIQELMERASQYYTGFVNLPVEGQVIGGVGLLVVLAALKNVWSILYPVRWTAASLLRIAAFLMNPRRRKKVQKGLTTIDVNGNAPLWDFTNEDSYNKVVLYYGHKKNVAELTALSHDQLRQIRKITGVTNTHQSSNKKLKAAYKVIRAERIKRERAEDMQGLVVQEAAPPCPPTPWVQSDTNALEARITELEEMHSPATPKFVEQAAPSAPSFRAREEDVVG